jgi:antirestriction protein ArdC
MNRTYGSEGYAIEELRAELSSAFIAGELGIPANIPQHASYISSWLKPLKGKQAREFHAGADAQRIVTIILGFHPEYPAQIGPSRCWSTSVPSEPLP